jgi:hypothetical protein
VTQEQNKALDRAHRESAAQIAEARESCVESINQVRQSKLAIERSLDLLKHTPAADPPVPPDDEPPPETNPVS